MIRGLLLAATLVVVAGCNSPGSAEANGDTKSLSQEIPKGQPQEKTFTAPGHSLLKEGPPGGGAPPSGGAPPAAGGNFDEKTKGDGSAPKTEAKSPKKGGM